MLNGLPVVDEPLRGLAIHEAARVMAPAGAGEILVSEITMQLAAGSMLEFEDRGLVELRGVTGSRRLYAVRPERLATPS